jgi:hypothetical protein
MRTSDILNKLLEEVRDPLSVSDVMDILGDRSMAVFIVFLGLPNCIPMAPPVPLVSALMLIVVAGQMMLGGSVPWLPQRIKYAALAQADVARVARKALPAVMFLERFSAMRMQWFGPRLSGVVMGGLLYALALCVIFAAPIIGQIPFGLAICLVGLGLVERDGVIVLIGTIVGGIGIFLSAGIAYALFMAAGQFF